MDKKSSPLFCAPEKGLLQRTTLPHWTWTRLMMLPRYLPRGQTETVQIPFLCFINGWLNCCLHDLQEQNVYAPKFS